MWIYVHVMAVEKVCRSDARSAGHLHTGHVPASYFLFFVLFLSAECISILNCCCQVTALQLCFTCFV